MTNSITDKARLLVVDDSVTVHMSLRDLLIEQDYDVLVAGGGERALELLRANPIDVLVLDLIMPDKAGVDVLREVKADPELASIPIILLTAIADRDELVACLDMGADDFVVKPWDERELLGRLRSMVRLKRAYDAVQDREQRLSTIINSVQAGILVVDPSNCIVVEVNSAALAMIGTGREEVVGHICRMCRDENDEPDAPCRRGPTTGSSFEQTLVAADGRRISVLTTATIVEIDGRELLLESFIDVTERKILERQLARAQKLESIGQLAAGIAHEINTPIQYVGDNIHFLDESVNDLLAALKRCAALTGLDGESRPWAERDAEVKAVFEELDVPFLSEELPKAAQQSLEGVERVATIIRAIKDFSRPARQEMEMIDVNKAIQSTLTVAQSEWKPVAEMVTDYDPNLPMTPCLVGEFNQVILNIVINAAHAVADAKRDDKDRKGLIKVATRRAGDSTEISVSDNGAGIPLEYQDKIFDHFFTTKEVGAGSGQGLSNAYAVINELHGGAITFETTPGKGTTFFVRLPLTQKKANQPENAADEAAAMFG